MKKLFRHPMICLVLLLLLAYIGAEFAIRGEALNRISFGIGGYLFWGGIILLAFCWIVLPIIRFTTFPQWVEPETFSDRRDKNRYLKKMGKYYISLFRDKRPAEIDELISELNHILKTPTHGISDYQAKLERIEYLVPEIHHQITEVVCDRIIRDYMKKTALLVCISQRGYLDSLAMLVMQFRMIVEISRNMGYRPSWLFLLSCFCWIMVNSLLFALFDNTEVAEDALQEFLPLVIGESSVNAMPIIGKIFNIVLQGASSMAVVYTTGKILQLKLNGSKKRLSGKERIKYRIDGYKEACKMLKDVSFSTKSKMSKTVTEKLSGEPEAAPAP